MEQFIMQHNKDISGVVSVFDRVIFKGYLPICYPQSADNFLSRKGILLKDYKDFTTRHTAELKQHAIKFAQRYNRPYQYLRNNVRKEEYARSIAERDHLSQGLICVLARNEENYSFGMRYAKGRPRLEKNKPQCFTLYFYFLDCHFGLMHVRLSTWMPFTIQVYINGHEWLARQMEAKGLSYIQTENSFTYIDKIARAQRIADKFSCLKWEKILHTFARKVNPLLKNLLKGMEYYWVIDQAEYATDVMVKTESWLDDMYLKWQKHSAVCFQAEDIMRFMGRKLHGSFNGLIVTDVKTRPSVTRIKHKVRGNWIKMYNKNGIVLRVETVINNPSEFRVFRLSRRGEKPGRYEPMRKGVTNMKRYAKVSLRSNSSYLNALAEVDDPTKTYAELKQVCEPVCKKQRRYRPLNPLGERDYELFEIILNGKHYLHGFKACDIGSQLGIEYSKNPTIRRRQSAYVNRKLRLLRAHGLIVRSPRSKRYNITDFGIRLMNATIHLYKEDVALLLKKAA